MAPAPLDLVCLAMAQMPQTAAAKFARVQPTPAALAPPFFFQGRTIETVTGRTPAMLAATGAHHLLAGQTSAHLYTSVGATAKNAVHDFAFDA